ncbi:BQ2448_7921 [Microbotryum intermedium]|uniref:BQ2448_7921 protein n=1 Tax=Microbotryum intermedium TaxID=269621 RepID=A0A238FMB0_9BASI|nr:BQ2448_7921 [Microbotryum intermedium]
MLQHLLTVRTRRASLRASKTLKSSTSTPEKPSRQENTGLRLAKDGSKGAVKPRSTESETTTRSGRTGSTCESSSKRRRLKDENEGTTASSKRYKPRGAKGETAGDAGEERSRSSGQGTSGAAASSAITSASATPHSGGGRHAHIGEKYQPGDGQRDYELTYVPTHTFSRSDHFTIPATCCEYCREILRQGSFCGGYFRPIKSKKSGRAYRNDWKDLPTGMMLVYWRKDYLTHPDPPTQSLNRWKIKVGQTYEAWEDQGWIDAGHDCRGWFQWYCRFFRGRRCADDDRQIGRWERLAGEKGGRWRRIYYGKYHKAGTNEIEPTEETVSKGIRQTLNHWVWQSCSRIISFRHC